MLEGNRVVLRPLQSSDWKNTIQWRNNMSIKEMAMMHPYPITEYVERDWYENILKSKTDRSVYFTISTKDDHPIGFCALTDINYRNQNCYLSIVIGDTEYQSKGFGKESTDLLISYAFKTINLRKLTLEVLVTNTPAIRLYEKIGFIEEGRLRQHFYYKGSFFDVLVLSLFRSTE